MKIFLLEFIDEAEMILKDHGADVLKNKDVKIIALHPKVIAFFHARGIPCEGTIPFLNNDALHRITEKSEELTSNVLNDLKFKDSLGLSQGYREFCLHHLRLHFNHYLWILEILKSASEKYRIASIYASVPQHLERMYTDKGYIHDSERFVGILAEQFCKSKSIEFHPFVFHHKKIPLKDYVLAFIARQCGRLLMGLEYLLIGFRRYKHGKTIVVPAPSYRMDLLLKEIRQTHPTAKSIMIWEGQDVAKQEMYKVYLTLTNIWKKFKKEELFDSIIHLDQLKCFFPKQSQTQNEFHAVINRAFEHIQKGSRELWSYQYVNISGVAAAKIDRGLRAEILKFQHSTYCLEKVLARISPKLLMSMYSGSIYYMMGELSTRIGYEALNISHGTHVPPNNKYEEIENIRLAATVITNTYPYVAVQTPWANKFLDYYKDDRKRIHTGPLLFSVTNSSDREKVRAEMLGPNHADKKIVIHASTQKGRHGMRPHITESLDEYLKTLSDIVNAVNQLENVHFLIRPHPICNLSKDEFKQLLPVSSKVHIMTKGGFARLLSASDVLISYSSTCIEEAVQNNIPVILYDQWKRYSHFGTPELKSPPMTEKPDYYLTEYPILKDTIQNALTLVTNVPEDKKWPDYVYPKDSKKKFFNFVNDVLNGAISNRKVHG